MAATIDEYLDALPEQARTVVTEIRRRIHANVGGVGEAIRYQIPAFTLDGRSFVHVGAWQRHIAVYPVPDGDEQFERDIAPYRTEKSTARFPLRQPVPYELIDRLVVLLTARRG